MTTDAVWEIPEPLSTDHVRLDADTTTKAAARQSIGPQDRLEPRQRIRRRPICPFWSLMADDFDPMVYDL